MDDETRLVCDTLAVRCHELEKRVRYLEKQIDTLGSPWWKRLWFRIDGWPPWWIVAQERSWRPWHRGR